jgi:tRNA threonylcarbamoyladenosine biosynthesis protein TsaE
MMQEKQIFVDSPEQMEHMAASMGGKAIPGICIELRSDLGGGKTTFTRGFVRGIGSLDSVSSPTFTIGKQYKTDNLTCYHFDFYRLQEPGLVAEELYEALNDPTGIIIVEWADTVNGVLPDDRMIVKIARVSEDADARMCTIQYSGNYQKLVEDL